MAKFEVTYTLTRTATYDVTVDADSLDEAKEIAQQNARDYNNHRTNDNSNIVLDAVLDLDSWCGWDTEVTDVAVEQMA